MKQIAFTNLKKSYNDTIALDCINLTLEPNKIYGLLGRNGAGKTTLLNLLTNKIFPTEGTILYDGESVFENDTILSSIFYMTETNLYPPELTVKKIFYWTREFYPNFDLDYAQQLARSFDLNIKKKVKSLSTGYASIFKAILTLASNADILAFDEPVLGLDANHRSLLYKEIIKNYSTSPKTILLSTHLIEEIQEIVEEVIIIDKGKLILHQSTEELLTSTYSIAGESNHVDLYVKDKSYSIEKSLGAFKSVIVFDSKRDTTLAKELHLEFKPVDLQNLFIHLTQS